MILYEKYLQNFKKTPNEQYREDVQAFVDDIWDNTTLLDKIILEDNPRTFNYENNNEVEVYIDSITEVSTNLSKIEGNYISVLFKDCYFQYNRGSMFYRPSNKSYYLVYQSTNDMRTISKCKAIQCNNVIKWIDVDTKQIIAYPCAMGQELTSTTSQDLKFISVAKGRTVIEVFGNEYTRKLQLNQRLIFNGVPYTINAIKNYEENNFVDREVELLFLYIEKSSIEPTDDYVYNIANFKEFQYLVNINYDVFVDERGHKGTLTAQLTCNNEIIDNVKFNWESTNSDVITIDKYGNYKVVGDIGNRAEIICTYIDDIYDKIPINVVDEVEDVVELRVTPSDDLFEIQKNNSLNLMVELFINDIKQENVDIFYNVNILDHNILNWENIHNDVLWNRMGNIKLYDEEYSGIDTEYYSITNTDNGITITCKKATQEILSVTFINREYSISKTINIKLKGVW